MSRKIFFFATALVLAAAFAARADERPIAPNGITDALERRIAGKAGLAHVRVDVFWSPRGKVTAARVFGDGVGVWQREAQLALSKSQVLEILRAIQKARFGSMPDRFGEGKEGEENEEREKTDRNEGPRLKGRLVVRAGSARKSTLQLVDGEQSEDFARLVEKILKVCEGPARKGVRAASMGEALRMVAAGKLSPEILEVAVQRRPDAKSGGAAQAGWTLRLDGRRASEQEILEGKPPSPARTLALSESELRELATVLAASDPSSLPQSLYAASYTDVSVAILRYSRTIAGRRFLGMTPDTHGESQKAFDRMYAALEELHARVARNGKVAPAAAD